ncbi:hypothetical protein OSB04_029629 [Centaurea solstitialis]|uniref:NAF domain-containing protein n=1 Tax=Centaurea solstitialis TaxID=347529 RepID=A0AA38SJ23_9ASTR|nr:hypothetical protein OSB04_029629 [Centaurea solstitialis]
MSIETLIGLPWFKKSLKPDPIEFSESESEIESESVKCKVQMNAFDIISMSSGLNLSGIFEEKIVRKERRFTTSASAAEVERRVAEVGERLGFRTKRMKDKENWNMEVVGLVKGRVVVVAKVLEVAVELLLVEMTVVAGGSGGDGGGFSDVEWEELTVGFQDIVVSWHC